MFSSASRRLSSSAFFVYSGASLPTSMHSSWSGGLSFSNWPDSWNIDPPKMCKFFVFSFSVQSTFNFSSKLVMPPNWFRVAVNNLQLSHANYSSTILILAGTVKFSSAIVKAIFLATNLFLCRVHKNSFNFNLFWDVSYSSPTASR